MLDWGGSSPRVGLLLAAQLSVVLHTCPAVLRHYAPHVRTLLLRGGPRLGPGRIEGE